MNETRSVKEMLEGKLEGRRGKGRPRQVDKWCERRLKETRCETKENESIGKREIGINYNGSQGQTERAVVL
jgi:hypothetical protein